MIVARFKPTTALPRIVTELQLGNEETRSEFVYALASYGAQAKPYVGALEALVAREASAGRRRQIQEAIMKIRNAQE
jgi:hypothetical protein